MISPAPQGAYGQHRDQRLAASRQTDTWQAGHEGRQENQVLGGRAGGAIERLRACEQSPTSRVAVPIGGKAVSSADMAARGHLPVQATWKAHDPDMSRQSGFVSWQGAAPSGMAMVAAAESASKALTGTATLTTSPTIANSDSNLPRRDNNTPIP